MSPHVETYSGYRADERPTRFVHEGQTVEVQMILNQWREPDADGFRVVGEDGKRYRLRHEMNRGNWTVSTT